MLKKERMNPMINPERKYVAVSIKHSEYGWKIGKPLTLWGYHITQDDEPRCFGGYTEVLEKAERYAIDDFRKHGYSANIVAIEPVKMSPDFCKRWKVFDTVLMLAEDYAAYENLFGLNGGSQPC